LGSSSIRQVTSFQRSRRRNRRVNQQPLLFVSHFLTEVWRQR
jgi:hypothetical protein